MATDLSTFAMHFRFTSTASPSSALRRRGNGGRPVLDSIWAPSEAVRISGGDPYSRMDGLRVCGASDLCQGQLSTLCKARSYTCKKSTCYGWIEGHLPVCDNGAAELQLLRNLVSSVAGLPKRCDSQDLRLASALSVHHKGRRAGARLVVDGRCNIYGVIGCCG